MKMKENMFKWQLWQEGQTPQTSESLQQSFMTDLLTAAVTELQQFYYVPGLAYFGRLSHTSGVLCYGLGLKQK